MASTILELNDIQSGVLRPRPTPYAATYVLFRIDERKAGRELMARLSSVVASATHPTSPTGDTWVSVALSFQGLKALGVPQASLDSFLRSFSRGWRHARKCWGTRVRALPRTGKNRLGHPRSMS